MLCHTVQYAHLQYQKRTEVPKDPEHLSALIFKSFPAGTPSVERAPPQRTLSGIDRNNDSMDPRVGINNK
ncbi:unnamed protein product [Arctogadus glacialis]